MTVTDSNATTDNASHKLINTTPHSPDAINTAPNTPNSATSPDAAAVTAGNKTSVRQLLYGREYPVAKGGII